MSARDTTDHQQNCITYRELNEGQHRVQYHSRERERKEWRYCYLQADADAPGLPSHVVCSSEPSVASLLCIPRSRSNSKRPSCISAELRNPELRQTLVSALGEAGSAGLRGDLDVAREEVRRGVFRERFAVMGWYGAVPGSDPLPNKASDQNRSA